MVGEGLPRGSVYPVFVCPPVCFLVLLSTSHKNYLSELNGNFTGDVPLDRENWDKILEVVRIWKKRL